MRAKDLIDVEIYCDHTIDYTPRRNGYLVYLNGSHRIDRIFKDKAEAKAYIDGINEENFQAMWSANRERY